MSKVTVGDRYRNKETGEVTKIVQAAFKPNDDTPETEDFGLIEVAPLSGQDEVDARASAASQGINLGTGPIFRQKLVGWDKFLDKWERIEGTEVIA